MPAGAEAKRQLEQARRIVAHPANLLPEEWLLLATLVGEAELAIRADPEAGDELRDLLRQVVGELRELTHGFTDPAFLRSSLAARRRNPGLFAGPHERARP